MKLKKIIAAATAGLLTLSVGKFTKNPDTSVLAAAGKTRVSVHDPSVVKDKNGTYYVFGSHIDAAKSTDLQNWTRFTNGYAATNNVEFGNLSSNLKKAFDWAGENLGDCEGGFAVWAPDVIWNPDYLNSNGTKGAYMMYFCTSSTWNTSVIAFATSSCIEGPYTFGDTLIYSGFTSNDSYAKSSTKNVNRKYTSTNIDELIASGEVSYNNDWFANSEYNYNAFPNAIDPTIYYDTDGKMYMVYGSWSGGIYTLEMNPQTGKCIHPKSGKTSDGRVIDSYFGTKLSGGYHKSGEGPFIEYNPDTGYYYLWETYGGLTSDGGYNMRVFRSKSPTGPFTDPAGRSGIMDANSNLDSTGLKVMGNYKFSSLNTAYMACGHNSVLRDDDGQWYLLYHARFNDGSEYHEVRVHQMYFNEEGWPVVSPFEYGGGKISKSGYNESDIVGDYEFINHGNATNGTIINYQNIKLNTDGTISGSVTGKWSQSPDSSAAEITIGNQKYSGYFLAAENEKGTKIMSFTAVGNNNQTVWGAKNSAFTGSERASVSDYTNSDAQLVIAPETLGQSSKVQTLSGTELLSGIPYFITNKNSGLSIDLLNGALDSGTNIQQWDFNKTWAQQWRLVAVDNEYFRIVSLGDETKCIAVAQESASDGVNVELQTYSGSSNQLFRLVKSGNYYGIVSKCSNGTGGLDVYEWSAANGGNINQWNYWEGDCQLWKITPVYPSVPTGTYSVRKSSGQYLGGSEIWQITALENGNYRFETTTGKILAPAMEISSTSSENPPEFRISCNKNGSYIIASESSSALEEVIIEPVFYTPPQKIIGDVNADKAVNIADLVMLEKFLIADSDELIDSNAADIDNDGAITSYDIVLLRKILL